MINLKRAKLLKGRGNMIKEFNHEEVQCIKTTVSVPMFRINVYLYFIDGLLIDTGPRRLKNSLIPVFKSLPVSQIILTHHHEDHIGMGSWIQSHINKPIYIHKAGIADCEQPSSIPLYRRILWGNSKPFNPEPIPQTIETKNYQFEVIHTPGHAHDHVVLFNRENGWLFSGDLFVIPHPKSSFSFESVPVLMDSIRKILTYDFSTLFCSHAGVIINGKEHLTEKLRYLENLHWKVKRLHLEGMHAKSIQKQLFPKLHSIHLLSGFENSPAHMINSIIDDI